MHEPRPFAASGLAGEHFLAVLDLVQPLVVAQNPVEAGPAIYGVPKPILRAAYVIVEAPITVSSPGLVTRLKLSCASSSSRPPTPFSRSEPPLPVKKSRPLLP